MLSAWCFILGLSISAQGLKGGWPGGRRAWGLHSTTTAGWSSHPRVHMHMHTYTAQYSSLRLLVLPSTDFGLISSSWLPRQWEAFVSRHRLVVGCTSISGLPPPPSPVVTDWTTRRNKTTPKTKDTLSFRPFHFRNVRIQWEITTRRLH
jgi:hypothetical protein